MAMRRGKIPPPNRVPQNTAGMAFREIESITAASWGPLPDGKGPQTQVHLTIRLKGAPLPLIMRCKTAAAVDQLVAMLERHRNDVWPGPDLEGGPHAADHPAG